jgi:ribosomal protein L40E
MHSIPVAIEALQANGRDLVLKAMNTWNLAQEWFITTYMGGIGTPFVFYETNSTSESMITVTFNQTSTESGDTLDQLGNTQIFYEGDSVGYFTRTTANISLDLTANGEPVSDTELQALATHEFGHALGLAHTTFSGNDLMNHFAPGYNVTFPSTLNLYAVYLLSKANNVRNLPQSPVTLPDNIPYLLVSQADLANVTPPAVQTETTALGLTELVSGITNPWLWIGVIVALAGVVAASTIRRRRRGPVQLEPTEPKMIFRDEPAVVETSVQPDHQVKKRCPNCGAEVPREALICRKCGMPAMYRK